MNSAPESWKERCQDSDSLRKDSNARPLQPMNVEERLVAPHSRACVRTGPLAQHTEVQPSEFEKLKIFRSPEAHHEAHARLMGMLAEIEIEPEASCSSRK